MGEGNVIGPNITGNTTAGIGSWTQAQFSTALRTGKRPDGVMLCATMSMYSPSTLPDQGVADLYAYLHSQNVATVNVGSCTH